MPAAIGCRLRSRRLGNRHLVVAACVAVWLFTGVAPAWSSTGRGTERHAEATGSSDPALGRIEAMAGATTTPPDTGGGGGNGTPEPCQWYPADLYLYLQAAPGPTERTAPDGTREVLYARVCDPADVTYHWLRDTVDPQQAVVVAMAIAQERIPAPAAMFAPDIERGAFVKAPLRFGITNGHPVSASASVPGVTATVTATPRRLEFTPGDGSPPADCDVAGPGAGTGADQPAAACTYTYRDSSTVAPNGESWPARLRVEWAVGWTATTGAGGDLPSVTTTADYAVPVREIQALEHAN